MTVRHPMKMHKRPMKRMMAEMSETPRVRGGKRKTKAAGRPRTAKGRKKYA